MVFIDRFLFQVTCIVLKIAKGVEPQRINRLRNRYLKIVDTRLKDGREKQKQMQGVISLLRKH